MKKKLTLAIAFAINAIVLHAQWSLTGNSIAATDFLGSTNAQPLQFKVNNVMSGLIDYDNTRSNTALGYQALLSNTGNWNTALGYQALFSNTTGGGNDAHGNGALYNNTTGSGNLGIGAISLYNNTSGDNNVAIGISTMYINTTGHHNTAVGVSSLNNNSTGAYNVAVGWRALFHNTTAFSNTAVGYQSLYNDSTGDNNTAHGYQALYSVTTGYDNSAVGGNALFNCNTGRDNTTHGYNSSFSSTTGNGNTAMGSYTLYSNSTGDNNTAIGNSANVNAGNYSNATMVGFQATATASDQVRIGNSSVTSIGGYANWSNISDGRFKKNIQENVPGLDFVLQLRPVTYNLDITGINKFIRPTSLKDKDGKAIVPSAQEQAAIKQKEQVIHTGFVAQEVEAVAKKMNYDFSGVDAAKSDKDLYGLRYSDFVVPLVKAVQELNSRNDSLLQLVNTLQAQINDIRQQMGNTKTSAVYSLQDGAPVLKQNIPNPFNSNTVIGYYVPANTGNARIMITDASGRSLQNISINGKGAGQITIAAGTLPSGNYIYSLLVDGQQVDSRKMVITK